MFMIDSHAHFLPLFCGLNSKQMSTAATAPKYGKTFQQTWLMDKGAWPVIGVLGGKSFAPGRQVISHFRINSYHSLPL